MDNNITHIFPCVKYKNNKQNTCYSCANTCRLQMVAMSSTQCPRRGRALASTSTNHSRHVAKGSRSSVNATGKISISCKVQHVIEQTLKGLKPNMVYTSRKHQITTAQSESIHKKKGFHMLCEVLPPRTSSLQIFGIPSGLFLLPKQKFIYKTYVMQRYKLIYKIYHHYPHHHLSIFPVKWG